MDVPSAHQEVEPVRERLERHPVPCRVSQQSREGFDVEDGHDEVSEPHRRIRPRVVPDRPQRPRSRRDPAADGLLGQRGAGG